MPKARAWPTHAEQARLDEIALALDIQYLTREVYAALTRDDLVEASRLNLAIYDKACKQQAIMRDARKGNS